MWFNQGFESTVHRIRILKSQSALFQKKLQLFFAAWSLFQSKDGYFSMCLGWHIMWLPLYFLPASSFCNLFEVTGLRAGIWHRRQLLVPWKPRFVDVDRMHSSGNTLSVWFCAEIPKCSFEMWINYESSPISDLEKWNMSPASDETGYLKVSVFCF